MGCFSFICKECGKPIKSNSVRGQQVKLFLLVEGKVVEQMEGEYDSYGRVLKPNRSDSIYWTTPWGEVCNLMFNHGIGSGIAAVHTQCYQGNVPTTQSEDDPDQGWGVF